MVGRGAFWVGELESNQGNPMRPEPGSLPVRDAVETLPGGTLGKQFCGRLHFAPEIEVTETA